MLKVLAVLAVILIASLSCQAQLAQVDASKLPQAPEVQAAYKQALAVEQYAQSWSDKWRYELPKADVAAKLSSSLQALQKAGTISNHELELATGLVAHLAYNVDVESAYEAAVQSLTKATKSEPGDIRSDWFLGIHECQSMHVGAGMKLLLSVEASRKKVPSDFWDDYIACANLAVLPGHALRAIDHAVDLGQSRQRYRNVLEIAETRYKTADLTKPVSSREAWSAEKIPGDRLRLTSRLCGLSFVASGNWGLQIPDVSHETCVVEVTPPARKGQASATVLILARSPKDEETVEGIARSILKGRTEGVSDLSAAPCPADKCVGFDVLAKDLYADEGGGHLLVTAFERDVPRYDGLLFEQPQDIPKTEASDKPVYFRFEPQYRRIPGKLFYVVVLDSNANIFAGARIDWEAVVKSIVVE